MLFSLCFKDTDDGAAKELETVDLAIYAVQCEGAEPGDSLADVGVVIEGCTVIEDLRHVANGCAILFGLIYCLNLNYPKDLRYTFEFLQKVVMELDGGKLSNKVQILKNKLNEWNFSYRTEGLMRVRIKSVIWSEMDNLILGGYQCMFVLTFLWRFSVVHKKSIVIKTLLLSAIWLKRQIWAADWIRYNLLTWLSNLLRVISYQSFILRLKSLGKHWFYFFSQKGQSQF